MIVTDSIPIIGVTADAVSDHQKQYIAADMDEVSMKPINLSDLLDKIDKTIGENIHSRIAQEISTKDTEVNNNEIDPLEKTSPDIEDFLKNPQDVAGKYDDDKTKLN